MLTLLLLASQFATPARALVIDSFGGPVAVLGPFSDDGIAHSSFQQDASALGGERDLLSALLGAGAGSVSSGAGSFDLILGNGSFTNLVTTQLITSVIYDGVDGSNVTQRTLDVDLTDGGQADRFLFDITYNFGSSGVGGSALPAQLRYATNVFGAASDAVVGASLVSNLGVNLTGTAIPLSLELAFSQLTGSGGAVSPSSIAALRFVFNLQGNPIVDLSVNQICTGNVSGCTSPAAVVAVPTPASLPLFASGLGLLGLLGWRRKRLAIA